MSALFPRTRAEYRRRLARARWDFSQRKTYREIRHGYHPSMTEAERIAGGYQQPQPQKPTPMEQYPNANYKPGWPAIVTDIDGQPYALVRDGVPIGDYAGHSCLYATLDRRNYIIRDVYFIPAIDAKPERLVMVSGGPWMTDAEFAAAGLPPMTLPSEPVEVA
jgi:hypothetical protein